MFGKKRTLLVVMAVLVAGSLVAALATSLRVMIGGRTIQGVGGAMFPLAFGIIRDEFPRERVAGGIALISGLFGIGGTLGIILAGPILAHLDYHWLFWIPCAAVSATAIATFMFVPESPVRSRGPVDWLGAILLSFGLVILLIAISKAPECGWLSSESLGLFVAAAGIATLWVWVEGRTANALVDMRMLRLRPVWTTNLAGFLFGLGLFSSFVLIPQFVETPSSAGYGFDSSVTQAGLFLIPSALMTVVTAPFSGLLSRRYGSKVPLTVGATVAMLAFVSLAVAHSAEWQVSAASFILGIGVGFAFAALPNLIIETVGPEQTGIATGINAVMRTVGGAIGGQLAASILAANMLETGLASERGYTLAFVVTALALAATLGASLAVPGRIVGRGGSIPLAAPQGSLE
jgi:EmrB/QacA subfamily drug resistance transporter